MGAQARHSGPAKPTRAEASWIASLSGANVRGDRHNLSRAGSDRIWANPARRHIACATRELGEGRASVDLDQLSDADLIALPLDRLAMIVLVHMDRTKEWNTYNFLNNQHNKGRSESSRRVCAEAVNWLLARGLISHGHPTQTHSEAMFITRRGREALVSGLSGTLALERLSTDLHHSLERVRSQFLIGEYELAAFAALREVEIRVRELAHEPNSEVGVPLQRKAWNPKSGPLADPELDGGERAAIADLFAGAIGTFKNPPSHRQVDYSDPTEASEIVLLADLLLRLLERTATRLGRP